MKHIPFVEFPLAEQDALLSALRLLGVRPQRVCVSRVELGGSAGSPNLGGFTTVSAPGLCRSYPADADLGWIHAMTLDLAMAPPQP
jgi:hypothetical protein